MCRSVLLMTSILVFTLFPRPGITAAESPWPMFRHDTAHSGRTDVVGPEEPSINWMFKANNGFVSSAAIGPDGTIYVGTGGNNTGSTDTNLYALTPDGEKKWQFGANGTIFSSPALGLNGTIYFGSNDYHIYAVTDDDSDVELLWNTHLGHWVLSSPVVAPDGTVYVGSTDFNIYALNPDGSVKWYYPTSWCVFSSPALGPDGTVYVGSKDEYLYALEDRGDSAVLKWRFRFGTFYDGHLADSSPAVGPDGTIYIGVDPYGAADQTPVPIRWAFYAINPDGTLKWKFEMKDGVESSPAIGLDGTVYVGSYDGTLYAIEDAGGLARLRWSYETDGPIEGSPIIDGDGTVYIGSKDGYLYAFNSEGRLIWRFEANGEIVSTPAINAEGSVLFGSMGGTFYSLGKAPPPLSVAGSGPETVLIAETYPNPFNAMTTLSFIIPASGSASGAVPVNLTIYDITGSRVTTLVDGMRQPGKHSAAWNGHDSRGNPVASGVYMYRLSAGVQEVSGPMTFVK